MSRLVEQIKRAGEKVQASHDELAPWKLETSDKIPQSNSFFDLPACEDQGKAASQ